MKPLTIVVTVAILALVFVAGMNASSPIFKKSGVVKNVQDNGDMVRILTGGGEMIDLSCTQGEAPARGQHIVFRYRGGALLDFEVLE